MKHPLVNFEPFFCRPHRPLVIYAAEERKRCNPKIGTLDLEPALPFKRDKGGIDGILEG